MKHEKIDKEWAEGPWLAQNWCGWTVNWSGVKYIECLCWFSLFGIQKQLFILNFFPNQGIYMGFLPILAETLRKVERGQGIRSGVAWVLQTCPFGIIKPRYTLEVRAMFGRSPEKSPFLRPSLWSWIFQTLKWSKSRKIEFLQEAPCWFCLIGNKS